MVEEFIKAFSLVFLAEIGDKSLLIAMYFSIKYLIKDVILGISIGVIANHGLAILLGKLLSSTLPIKGMQFLAGLMFIFFGFLILREIGFDEFKEDFKFNPILTVALTYFIGELGDKTQITAMTLAIESNHLLIVLLATSSAMIVTSGLGIYLGSKMGNKIPEMGIKLISSIIFIIIGSLKTIKYMPKIYLDSFNKYLFLIIVGLLEIYFIYRHINNKDRREKEYNIKTLAEDIYQKTERLNLALDEICLGEEICGSCNGEGCLVGHAKHLIKNARENDMLYNKDYIDIKKLIKKNYNRDEVIRALSLIIIDYEINGWISDPDYIINKIKVTLESILFNNKEVKANSLKEYLKILMKIDEKTCIYFTEEIFKEKNSLEEKNFLRKNLENKLK